MESYAANGKVTESATEQWRARVLLKPEDTRFQNLHEFVKEAKLKLNAYIWWVAYVEGRHI